MYSSYPSSDTGLEVVRGQTHGPTRSPYTSTSTLIVVPRRLTSLPALTLPDPDPAAFEPESGECTDGFVDRPRVVCDVRLVQDRVEVEVEVDLTLARSECVGRVMCGVLRRLSVR